jgi:hypothetical protein
MAKILGPSRKPLFFQHFKTVEYFANPRKLGKVLKLSSSHEPALEPLSEMAGRVVKEAKNPFL